MRSLRPALGAAVASFGDALKDESRLETRVREAARIRIAQSMAACLVRKPVWREAMPSGWTMRFMQAWMIPRSAAAMPRARRWRLALPSGLPLAPSRLTMRFGPICVVNLPMTRLSNWPPIAPNGWAWGA